MNLEELVSEMQDNPSRNQDSAVQPDALAADVQQMLRLAAEPVASGELVTAQIRRAARVCKLTYNRARKLWYGECRVSGVDFVAVTSAIARHNESLIAYQNAKAVLLREHLTNARDV